MNRDEISWKEDAECEERETGIESLDIQAKGRARRNQERNEEGRIQEWCCKSQGKRARRRVVNNISQY